MAAPPAEPPEEELTGSPRICVRCVSDVHVDIEENLRWVAQLPAHEQDVLIVAGDLSDNLELVRTTLRTLKQKYAEVFCVPGNHDLWLRRKGDIGIKDSMAKLRAFLAMCADEGVHTRRQRVGAGSDGAGGVWIVPLLSWHHQSFDTEPDITCWEGIPPVEKVMTDFRSCKWPEPLSHSDESVARAVDELNDVDAPPPVGEGGAPDAEESAAEAPIISFSHFLPRIELSPEKRFLFLPVLNKAVGSRFLGERVRKLQPAVHVFGHTHFGWDATLEGTRYIQAALGYPDEWQTRRSSMQIGELQREPVVIWDSLDGFVPPMPARWSGYYAENPRRPELTHTLAPYVARMYRKLPGGQICESPFPSPAGGH